MKDKILLVADCVVEGDFAETLEKKMSLKADTICIDATNKAVIGRVKRHLYYFILATKAYKNRKKYKYIIFWQQFIGFYYGVLWRIFCRSESAISLLLPLIYKRRRGIVGKMYEKVFIYLLKPKALNMAICHSSKERDFYLKQFGEDYAGKIKFVHYGINEIKNVCGEEHGEKYFFSGGASNRDYKTLIKAFCGIKEKLKIVCYPENIPQFGIVPENVSIICGLSKDEFLRLMSESTGVIIPLEDPFISSGQLVLLQAMALKKPIIATKSYGICDYIDESNAFIVKDHSSEDIQRGIKLFESDAEYVDKISKNAYNHFKDKFTRVHFSERVADILENR